MTLWRISNHSVLDGAGGLRGSGRWHTRGRRIVYCAPNPATALVEILVNLEVDAEDIPVRVRYLEIEVTDPAAIEGIDLSSLPAEWRADSGITRRIGDAWLASGHSALMRVPCAVVPATTNVLINPLHPGSRRAVIKRVHEQAVDARLIR